MPSVGMRRSTRVFVPKTKDGDGVRVLRSGRRLWVESIEAKIKGSGEGTDCEDLFRLIDGSDEAVVDRSKGTGWQRIVVQGRELDAMVLGDVEKAEPQLEKRELPIGSMEVGCSDEKFGIVYSRKRKRVDLNNKDSSVSISNSDVGDVAQCGDRKFRWHYFRRKRIRISKASSSLEKGVDVQSDLDRLRKSGFLSVSVDSSCDRSCSFVGVLSSILRYMSTAMVGLVELSLFLLSHPVGSVFASCGIHLLRNGPCNKRSGFCKIYGAREFIPLFDVNFLAAPLCFIHLHVSMGFRSLLLSSLLLITIDGRDEDNSNLDDILHYSSSDRSHAGYNLGDLKTLNIPFGVSGSPSHSVAHRNVVTTHDFWKRRKRSLRIRKARDPSSFGVHIGSASSVDSFIRKNSLQLPSVVPNQEIQKSVQKNSSAGEIKLLKSTLLAMGKDIDKVFCSANVLITELDWCYRESGAHVTLELSTSNEWILAIRKNGSLRYYHTPQQDKEIKPNSTNRYTYAIVWGVEAGWKLEFTKRKDWVIFKELFKVCGDRNVVPPSPAKAVPTPGLFEVSVCGTSHDAPYVRPESYIKMNDDELSRVLKRTANYDMDSEDEEWLNTFNGNLGAENDLSIRVTYNTFELMIDALEKAIFSNPDDFTDEIAPVNLCSNLCRREVVEAMYSYCMNKRKQKSAPLIRFFQLNEPKEAPLEEKPFLRKKRSMKQRHTAKATPSGRGKQISVLQVEAERNARGMLEVEEARAALDVAIAKRRRVQTLMESADLAMYRATMADRIAEAAEPDQAVAHFLD